MKKKVLIIGMIAIFSIIISSFTISAQQTITIKKSNKDPYVTIEGEITGIIFDIHGYYIFEGVDNDFYSEGWECTIPYVSGINVLVPTPEDEQDHYRITGKKEGYKTKTVDLYVTPEDDWKYVHISLTPIVRSKNFNLPFFRFLNFNQFC